MKKSIELHLHKGQPLGCVLGCVASLHAATCGHVHG